VKLKKPSLRTIIFYLVLLSLAGSIVFIVVQLISAPSGDLPAIEGENRKSDYVLMLVQCALGLLVLFLPSLLERRLRVEVPDAIEIMYFVFLYAAIYLGEVRSFYYRIPNWDLILHTFSGLMLGALGFSVVNLLNRNRSVAIELSPAFVALFAFLFSVSVGALWEVYEFSVDGLLRTNMQKFAQESGELLSGREALRDTMEDLIVDMLGACCIAVLGFFSLKYKKGWIARTVLPRQTDDKNREE